MRSISQGRANEKTDMSKWQKTLKRQGHFKKALPNANCSHCPILARFFTRRQVEIKSQTNAWNRRQIGARSREWQSHSVNYQRHYLRESPMRRQRPWNICHAKYPELSAIQNPAVWMSSDWKIHRWPTANERARYRAAGRTFFFLSFFIKQLLMYKQRGNISKFFA